GAPARLRFRYHLPGKALHLRVQFGIETRARDKARREDHEAVHPGLSKPLDRVERERQTRLQPNGDLDPREVTTSLLREFFQERKPGLDAVRGIADAKPAIPELCCPFEGWSALASKDDGGIRFLHWLGVKPQRRKAVKP